jgi:hypothetical protein
LSALFRRREVWLPTGWGWLLLLAIAGLATVALGLSARSLLALDAPARGPDARGARTLVVEGWLADPELAQAVAAFKRGRYERVLTTGGPIEAWIDVGNFGSFALRAAAYLRGHGITEVPVIALPAPDTKKDRSYLTALMVRDWARREGVALQAVDVYSVGVHTRRSRTIYRMALGDGVEVGALAARPADYDDERWWASSTGAKKTLNEVVSLAWTACCFWPSPGEAAAFR